MKFTSIIRRLIIFVAFLPPVVLQLLILFVPAVKPGEVRRKKGYFIPNVGREVNIVAAKYLCL